ncbi:hypothetical protein [Hydromonas duriensis]|uniref:Uncharacterized protein n=1 Tax=Hydromonas duriensis TaxID=1527608 RepID=A0A4R6Y6P9_9BURK|nr:hypothetical protein [Hydromonas duriensis]TDR27027.1 hypothetical protein DFR44_1535 [Hydromonas duriensis]
MSFYFSTRLRINLKSLSEPLLQQLKLGKLKARYQAVTKVNGKVETIEGDATFDSNGYSSTGGRVPSRYSSWDGGAKSEVSAQWYIFDENKTEIWHSWVNKMFTDAQTTVNDWSVANIVRAKNGLTTNINNGEIQTTTTTPPDFYNFNYQEIEAGINARIANPYLIDQGSSSLCGMAASAHFYAQKRQSDYEQFVKSLHKYGKATSAAGYQLTTDTDKHLQQYAQSSKKYPASSIVGKVHPVDFILLASLRDHLNGVFDYDPDSDNAGGAVEGGTGMSLPGDVTTLFKNMIGLSDVSFVLPIQTPSFKKDSFTIKSLDEIKSYLDKGYCVAMLIRMNLLSNKISNSPIPEHWIGIHELTYDANERTVDMTVFTWGQSKTYSKISFGAFNTNFLGFAKGL